MMLDATQNYDKPLTAERLFGWHAALFPTGRSGMNEDRRRRMARRKTGPMQVVSGPIGRERVHFEAPDAPTARPRDERLSRLVQRRRRDLDPVLKAAHRASLVRHHPSVRGWQWPHRARHRRHGARALGGERRSASTACPRKSGRSGRLTTTSSKRPRKATSTSRPGCDWFLGCLDRAFDGAETILASRASQRRDSGRIARGKPFNERQRKVINRLLDGFEGKLTSSKWATLAKMLAGHRLARHRRSRQTRHPRQRRGRRTQHELFARGDRMSSRSRMAKLRNAMTRQVGFQRRLRCGYRALCMIKKRAGSRIAWVELAVGVKPADGPLADLQAVLHLVHQPIPGIHIRRRPRVYVTVDDVADPHQSIIKLDQQLCVSWRQFPKFRRVRVKHGPPRFRLEVRPP